MYRAELYSLAELVDKTGITESWILKSQILSKSKSYHCSLRIKVALRLSEYNVAKS